MKQLILTFIVLATVLPSAQANGPQVCSALLEKINSAPFEKYVNKTDAENLKKFSAQNRWEDPLASHSEYTIASLRFISAIKWLYSPGRQLVPLSTYEQVVVEDWFEKNTTSKAILSDAVRLEPTHCEEKTEVLCYELEKFNVETILRPLIFSDMSTEEAGKATFISVKGIGIVGVVKQVGEPTLVALRDVKNSVGEATLIRGAAYHVSADLLREELAPRKRAGEKFSVINVNKLTVVPGRFLEPTSEYLQGLFERFNEGQASSRLVLRRQWRQFRAALSGVLKSAEKYVAENSAL